MNGFTIINGSLMLRTYYPHVKLAYILTLLILLGMNVKGQFISGISLQGGAVQTTFAPGDDIVIFGSDLYTTGNCDTILIEKKSGNLIYRFIDNIDYTSTEKGPSGRKDSLFLTLPLDMDCDSFYISLKKFTNCATIPTTTPPFNIEISDSIDFTYADSIFCIGESNPYPTLSTSHYSYPIWSSQNQVFDLNSATGEIFMTLNSHGVDNVIAKTVGTVCFDRDTFKVSIDSIKSGYTLTYANYTVIGPDNTIDGVCGNTQGGVDGILKPINPVPDSLGKFSSSPGLVVFSNPDSGFIDLANTPPGNYKVFYEPNPNLCYQTKDFDLTIIQPASAVFDYEDTYCPPVSFLPSSDCTIYPLITQLPPINPKTLGFQDADSSNANPDKNTGAIDISGLASGEYVVEFKPDTSMCFETVRDTFELLQAPNVLFEYPADTFCKSSPPINANLTGGTYFDTASPPNLVFYDSLTGAIDFGSSNIGGPYSVFYKASNSVCTDIFSRQIYIQDPAIPSVEYRSNAYCQNGLDPSPVFTDGILGGTFTGLLIGDTTKTLLGLNDSTGTIDLDVCRPGTYQIEYDYSNGICDSMIIVDTIRIDSFYPFDISLEADNYCENSGLKPISVYLMPDTTTVVFLNTFPDLDNYEFRLFSGNTPFTGAIKNDSIYTDTIPPQGNYRVELEYNEGVCSNVVSDYFDLYDAPDASFEYLSNILCKSSDDPVPHIIGQGGGVFTALQSDIVIDTIKGRIDLDSSSTGSYDIVYTVSYESKECYASDTFSVEIIGSDQAIFNYPDIEVCKNDTPMVPEKEDPNADGTFSIASIDTDQRLECNIDIETGRIDPASCDPGTYAVTHTLSGSQSEDCEASYVTRITILQHDKNATLDYGSEAIFCPSDTFARTAVPINNDSVGFFPGVAGLVFENDSLGIIDLQLSKPDTYEVKFIIEGDCPLELTDTIIISEFTPPEFYYSGPDGKKKNTFCSTDRNPVANALTRTGFYEVTTNNGKVKPWVNPITGAFYLDSVSSNDFSPFRVCHTPDTSFNACTYTHCEELIVNLGPENAEITVDIVDSTALCEGDAVTFEINNVGSDYEWFLNGVSTNDSGTTYKPDPMELVSFNIISVEVTNILTCKTTVEDTLVVYPKPKAVFTFVPTIVSSSNSTNNNPVNIRVTDSLLDGVTFHWSTSYQNHREVYFDPEAGSVGPGQKSQEETISTSIDLKADSKSAALIIFKVVPETEQCTGDSAFDTIRVNPVIHPIFIPEVFTPNSDGINDVWQIQSVEYDLSQFTMLVYNRSGSEVFKMKPVTSTWDGGSLPDGVYWWKLLDENGIKLESGGVTIRRK